MMSYLRHVGAAFLLSLLPRCNGMALKTAVAGQGSRVMPGMSSHIPGKRITCVGDSVTLGLGGNCIDGVVGGCGYVGLLDQLLGEDYAVSGFGEGGATVSRGVKGQYSGISHSYWDTDMYLASLRSQPDVVVIEFGIMDGRYSTQHDWDAFAAEFENAYASMIRSFQSLPSRPEVLIAIPVPDFNKGQMLGNITLVNGGYSAWIPQIAKQNGLAPPIDLFALFKGHCPNLGASPCDWIDYETMHPNPKGYEQIAQVMFDRL